MKLINPRFKSASIATACLALCTLLPAGAMAQTAVTDLGPAADDQEIEVAIALKPVNRDDLVKFVASTVDPSSANFHKFITPEQFAQRYGQSAAVIDRVKTALAGQGIQVTNVFNNGLVLQAKATNAQMSRLLGVSINNYSDGKQTFQRATTAQVTPAALADVVESIAGVDTTPHYRAHLHKAHSQQTPYASPHAAPVFGSRGALTFKDVATLYNVTPLQNRGITGAGTTIGIMTFASFTTSDVTTYWSTVGLTGDAASAGRITTIKATSGTISTNGADETTLDIQQSGGIAPGAKIIVYEAANTDAGELALYTKAINDNLADTLSISWGAGEIAESASSRQALETLFLQAAAQGTPISAASGDDGAYDFNSTFAYPGFSTLLSVDYPSSSPSIVAAGGTTLPFTATYQGLPLVVPQVRAWSWDYFRDIDTAKFGLATVWAEDYAAGAGGGVSVIFPVPDYQQGLAGVQTSAAGQALFCLTSPTCKNPLHTGTANRFPFGTNVLTSSKGLALSSPALAAGFAGRNTPDVSLNADPESGYATFVGGAWDTGGGGTSFVAPQLNGIFALITQQAGGRIGMPHPQMYAAFKAMGYGPGSPFTPVTAGTNGFYKSINGYNPATGLGQLDVDALSNVMTKAARAASASRTAKR